MTRAVAKFDAVEALSPMVQASNAALVFTRRVDAADEMAALLRDHGVKAESLHSDLTRTERVDCLAHLKVGRLKALVAPTVLDEGIDVPPLTWL
jgi:superfamily II DNA/RNA helicase